MSPVIAYDAYRRSNRYVILANGEIEPVEEWDYEPEIDDEFASEEEIARKQAKLIGVAPSQFVEFAIRIPNKELQKHVPFSFDGRKYLRLPYDTPSKRTLYKCGRQVEKTEWVHTLNVMSNGRLVEAKDVKVGDELATMSADGVHMTTGKVVWVSRFYDKPCVRITTRQGHVITIALTHPMRKWGTWAEAGGLHLRDRLAAVRRCGEFTAKSSMSEERVRLTAYLIGDGGLSQHTYSFTSVPGAKLDEFLADIRGTGGTYRLRPSKSKAVQVFLHFNCMAYEWMKEDGLAGKKSADKYIPDWVFDLDRRQTALFLNRLWSTDGHVKKNGPSKYSIEYCSISQQLIKQVQALLWKFGIPSKIRENWPSIYKRRGEKKLAYILRIETQEGVRRFLTDIGALGKVEDVVVPDSGSNNNRDTFPDEVNELIKQVIDSRGNDGRMGCQAETEKSLRTAGLRETLKYPPTMGKVQQYVAFFRSDERYDQQLVDQLEVLLTTDLYWDEIVSIEDTGVQTCIDFEVEGTHNFVAEGLITHNSTLLGNKCLSYCCIVNAFNVLYVSPTNQQTKTFSADRLKEPIETSEILKAWTTTKLSDNVFLKKFINRSQITLRYAYHNADRTRGIPADLILIDEIQDVITDNIPVVEECASHSHYKLFIYSGTPKTTDNAIEHYWVNFSTQNEWVVPCEHHGTPNDSASWHWNILGEENIGREGLVCDRCRQPINAMHPLSQWAAMNPGVKDKLKDFYEGYRIPQLMVPWMQWGEILDKYTKFSRSVFYNEVLGLSYDSGTRPLTRKDIQDNCLPGQYMGQESLTDIKSQLGVISPVYAGIDWGCHDEETRILTPRGFIHFRDLTDEDKVAQWDPDTREMAFVTPEVRTVKDWDQPLHHFKGKGLDMMLTHTHRMRVMPKVTGEQSWRTEPCERTVQRGGSVFFVGHVDWKGKERQSFVLPGQPTSPGFQGVEPRPFFMDEWLEFLGYYLSEGGLCFDGERPSCIKMSQRETVNPGKAKRIGDLLQKLFSDSLSTFPNPKTGDINWTIYGKQVWAWALNNVGECGHWKRIPREFLSLSKRQLRILFDAMMLGDGNTDPRPGNDNGYYCSTSKGLCEDFQELCIRLGLRSTLSLHKPEEENRKARWRVSWSTGRDFQYNDPKRTKTVPYKGKVYCCKVPTGYIVTERNGCIAYQGNTGEGSYSVIALGTYLHDYFNIFYIHRFEGQEIEPPIQLELIEKLIRYWDARLVGCDYGGGFDRNDALARTFGRTRIVKYQYSQPSMKVRWDDGMNRYLVHRTEVMSDIFNAIKRRDVFRFPDFSQFEDPFGKDMLNIFSEYSETQRQVQYKHAPDATDDSFHAILLCFLASMIRHPRYDVLNPTQKTGYAAPEDT